MAKMVFFFDPTEDGELIEISEINGIIEATSSGELLTDEEKCATEYSN